MSVEELDRVAAGLPEWEGSPSPAPRVYGQDSPEVLRRMAQADREYRRMMDWQMTLLQRTEWVLFILTGSLLAGLVVAWVVDRLMSGGAS